MSGLPTRPAQCRRRSTRTMLCAREIRMSDVEGCIAPPGANAAISTSGGLWRPPQPGQRWRADSIMLTHQRLLADRLRHGRNHQQFRRHGRRDTACLTKLADHLFRMVRLVVWCDRRLRAAIVRGNGRRLVWTRLCRPSGRSRGERERYGKQNGKPDPAHEPQR